MKKISKYLFFILLFANIYCSKTYDYKKEYYIYNNTINLDFDDLQFRTFYNSILSDIPVYDLAIDSAGTIWCATEYGLYRYDGNRIYDKITGINSKAYTVFYENDTSIWVGTHNRGLVNYNPITQQTHTYLITYNNKGEKYSVYKIGKLDSNIIAGSSFGVYYLDKEHPNDTLKELYKNDTLNKVKRLFIRDKLIYGGIDEKNFFSLDIKGNVDIISDHIYFSKAFKLSNHDSKLNSILILNGRSIRLTEKGLKIEDKNYLNGIPCYSAVLGLNNILYIASKKGIYYANLNPKLFFRTDKKLGDTMFEVNNKTEESTFGGETIPTIVQCYYYDKKNKTYYIGTKNGLYKKKMSDTSQNKSFRLSGTEDYYINSIAASNDNKLFLATLNDGLQSYNLSSPDNDPKFELVDSVYNAEKIISDSGKIYFITSNLMYEYSNNLITVFNPDSPISDFEIIDGKIWLVCLDKLLVKSGEDFNIYTVKDRIPHGVLKQIKFINDTVFLKTNERTYYCADKSLFHPSRPYLFIGKIISDSKPVNLDSLFYKKNNHFITNKNIKNLTIQFSGMIYNDQVYSRLTKTNSYGWLPKQNTEFENTEKVVNFSNLEAGDYILEFSADKYFSKKNTFYITRPVKWFERWTSLFIGILSILGATFLIIRIFKKLKDIRAENLRTKIVLDKQKQETTFFEIERAKIEREKKRLDKELRALKKQYRDFTNEKKE